MEEAILEVGARGSIDLCSEPISAPEQREIVEMGNLGEAVLSENLLTPLLDKETPHPQEEKEATQVAGPNN